MNNEFEDMIKNIEDEILALKTAKKYSSVRSAYSISASVYTGLYQITYAESNEEVLSFVYGSFMRDNYGTVWARTPIGKTQVIEINSDTTSYPSQTQNITMTIVSNLPVINIVRLS